MQAVPVRSCIIVDVQKPAEVTANAARQDSGALRCNCEGGCINYDVF